MALLPAVRLTPLQRGSDAEERIEVSVLLESIPIENGEPTMF
jgi:hypothetical protein